MTTSRYNSPTRTTSPPRGSAIGAVRAARSSLPSAPTTPPRYANASATSKGTPSPNTIRLSSLSSSLAGSPSSPGSSGTRGAQLSSIYGTPGGGGRIGGGAAPPVGKSLDTSIMGGLGLKAAATHLIPSIGVTMARAAAQTSGSPKVPSDSNPSPSSSAVSLSYKSYVTIVFDLDETLCNNRRAGRAILRPGALDILRHLRALSTSSLFVEIILWTASMECVAKPVIQRLDPNGTIFNHLIYRDRRWYKESGYTKDLRRLGRDMRRCVIIENSELSVELNRKNAILVKDFIGGPSSVNDNQLHVTRDCLSQWCSAITKEIELEDGTEGSTSDNGVSDTSSNNTNTSNNGDPQSNGPSPAPNPSPSISSPTTRKNGAVLSNSNKQQLDVDPYNCQLGPGICEFLAHHSAINAGNEVVTMSLSRPGAPGVVGTPAKSSPLKSSGYGARGASTPGGFQRFPSVTAAVFGGGGGLTTTTSSYKTPPTKRMLSYR